MRKRKYTKRSPIWNESTDRQGICRVVGERISNERNKTHGDPQKQLALATMLKATVLTHGSTNSLTPVEIESLSSILTKVSRVVCGKPIADHWEDIMGYAAIAAESRSRVQE